MYVTRVIVRLTAELTVDAGTTETADLFLEQCLIPRMKMTLEDAMFSAKVLFLLHQLQVPNYNLLDVCNKVRHSCLPNIDV